MIQTEYFEILKNLPLPAEQSPKAEWKAMLLVLQPFSRLIRYGFRGTGVPPLRGALPSHPPYLTSVKNEVPGLFALLNQNQSQVKVERQIYRLESILSW